MSEQPSGRCALSVVVVAYDMARELPRTLTSLSVPYQQRIHPSDFEIIVVDNGSPCSLEPQVPRGGPVRTRFVRLDPAPASPAHAANIGIAMADGDLVGLVVDGARMASPGLLAHARLAARLAERPVVATLGWHLGSGLHSEAATTGHDEVVEDALLESIGWETDGYRLFEVSTLAASSARGWFGPMGESNGLFMPAAMWDELGGLDERFQLPGGGRVNHDLYSRACQLDASQLVLLLGEGTFHQTHGGAFTSGAGRRDEALEEYEALRGRPYVVPEQEPIYVGRMPVHALPALEHSVRWAMRRDGESGRSR